ncbi:MAG TPA: ion transporter [Leptolyngbya sp.]|jgi:voltage-gated potassium channel|nr:ion transporter [Leptolyngbya sp.]
MPPNTTPEQQFVQERSEILQQLEDWLETPMIVLGFAWFALLIVELIWGLNSFLEGIGITIWIIFVLDFGLKFVLAPRKFNYLRRNWLTAFSLFLPALRIFRIFRVLRLLRGVRAVRGLQLLQVLTRTNRGMRALSVSFNRRGFGYVMALTAIMTLIGATGIYTFERDAPGGGIDSYSEALWWTAMLMTTMGSEYFPKTPEGRILCLLLSLYAFAVFGYVTATLSTFFIGRDADDGEAEIAGEKSIQSLQAEVTALRSEIQVLIRQNHDREVQ